MVLIGKKENSGISIICAYATVRSVCAKPYVPARLITIAWSVTKIRHANRRTIARLHYHPQQRLSFLIIFVSSFLFSLSAN